jgi:hypothetical protein
MTVAYVDDALVGEIILTEAPPNPYPSGYGPKIPTRYKIRYGARMHRVYVMLYSNSGSSYIISGGEDLFLDTITEYRIECAVEGRFPDPFILSILKEFSS